MIDHFRTPFGKMHRLTQFRHYIEILYAYRFALLHNIVVYH
jgi:hypothetical protein